MPLDEHVISEKVLGSSNPVARFGRSVSSSVTGIFFGIVLIVGSFGLLWWGEQQHEYSKDVAALPLVTSVSAGHSGAIKVQAVPVVSAPLQAPIVNQSVLYYEYRKQEFKKIKERKTETRTVQREGKDVQQTIEKEVLIDKWFDVASEKKWAGFSVGGASVEGAAASLGYIELKKFFDKETPVSSDAPLNVVQKTRETVVGIPVGIPLLVVGSVNADVITNGAPFIITDSNDAALVAAIQSSESRAYWGFKIVAWLLMTIGFVMLFGPVAALLNVLPGLGKLFNGILFLVFGVVSASIVMLGTIVIRYWWAVLIVLVAVIVLAVIKMKRGGTAASA